LEKREREIEEGSRSGKRERTGGFGQKPFFFLANRTEAGEGAARHGRPAAIPGEPGHCGGRVVSGTALGVPLNNGETLI
jgi:hypothetical protein